MQIFYSISVLNTTKTKQNKIIQTKNLQIEQIQLQKSACLSRSPNMELYSLWHNQQPISFPLCHGLQIHQEPRHMLHSKDADKISVHIIKKYLKKLAPSSNTNYTTFPQQRKKSNGLVPESRSQQFNKKKKTIQTKFKINRIKG